MPVPTVRLKLRVKLLNGSRAYLDPVLSPNGKLKPLYALVGGMPVHRPEGALCEASSSFSTASAPTGSDLTTQPSPTLSTNRQRSWNAF
jgi:hypothetical protein